MFKKRVIRQLELKKNQGLYRAPVKIEKRCGKYVQIAGREVLSFSSNDYLGLSELEKTKKIVSKNFQKFATSSSSSRLVSGNYSVLNKAEDAYAKYFGFEAALFYPSGYQANLGLLSTIFESGDCVFFDKHVHASAVKGLEMSGAKLTGYNHNSFSHLKKRVEKSDHKNKAVVTESLFSMDGDIPDVKKLEEYKKKYEMLLVVDESHSFGVLGNKGKGVAEKISDISVGTFGKAPGLFGAFVLLPAVFKEYLFNFSSPLIYSTTLPEAHAASAHDFLEVIEESDKRREKLKNISIHTKEKLSQEGFKVFGDAHILSVFVGDEMSSSEISKEMLKKDILTFPARFPTVKKGEAILRLGMSTLHDENDIKKLLVALKESFNRCDVEI